MDDASLKAALHTAGLAKLEKLLIPLLAAGESKPQEVKAIRAKGAAAGLRVIKDWNISQMLSRSHGQAILVEGGWELTEGGKQHLAHLGIAEDRIVAQPATTLRKLLPKISNQKNRDFIAEAVSCYECKNLRAASVLAWVGAVSILYEHVIQHALAGFSSEWVRRNPQKNRPITTVDDLSDIKEDVFLDVLHSISVIGKSVKDELKGCLKFRNGCGHPNTLVVGETRVAAHLETLINNVYLKF